MQIQQIHDVEPVATQIPGNQHDYEIDASRWVNFHILELSSTYVVAFEGFREENSLYYETRWKKGCDVGKGEKNNFNT